MNNRNEFNEKAGEFYKCFSTPLAALAELNMKTMNQLSQKNDVMETLAQAKTPEQMMGAQMKMAHNAAVTGLTYLQQACDIWLDALSQSGQVIEKNVQEATRKASNAAHGGQPNNQGPQSGKHDNSNKHHQ